MAGNQQKKERAMPVNATHPDYDASLPAWLRARDVIAGEDAVKSAGEKYLPRLEAQTDEEYDAYRARASLFNATARTADGYLGLLFRRAPFIKVPEAGNAIGKAMRVFVNDADMLGMSFASYARNVAREVIAVGGISAAAFGVVITLLAGLQGGAERKNGVGQQAAGVVVETGHHAELVGGIGDFADVVVGGAIGEAVRLDDGDDAVGSSQKQEE